MKDIKTLIGKTLWIAAAGQMDYYPYANHHADYSKSQGVLLRRPRRLSRRHHLHLLYRRDLLLRRPPHPLQLLEARTMGRRRRPQSHPRHERAPVPDRPRPGQ
jgi:hypothetical protein